VRGMVREGVSFRQIVDSPFPSQVCSPVKAWLKILFITCKS
jgi:hypothetical protein